MRPLDWAPHWRFLVGLLLWFILGASFTLLSTFLPVYIGDELVLGVTAFVVFGFFFSPEVRAIGRVIGQLVKPTQERSEGHMSETSSAVGSVAEELRNLGELKDSGVLTEAEFSQAKARLLSQAQAQASTGQTAPAHHGESSAGTTQGSRVLAVIGVILVAVSIACFVGASEMSSYTADPGAVARSLFSGDAAYRLQQARSQAQLLQSGAIVSLVIGTICLGIGLIRIVRR